MSEPEIARRCSACGVSLRQRAIFCPQCGQQIGDTDVRETQILEPPNRDIQSHEDPSLTTPALTGVAGNVRDRVERIKHVSSVMIDQAAYDPSLRFLLVAAALFVVFLVLLILSKVIG
ncbi:MAG TPA: zinc ribbon domain-containing protein [Pyrinomonadaceae bacterium]|nr:zinc ribbon domain-containing protein [Pyrinomonadaceae bacterium]